MKFEKTQAFEKLKGILTNNGRKTLRMSERSINEMLEDLIPLVADDEMELDAFVEKVKKMFETANSNAEKDRSDFIKDYQKSNAANGKGKKGKEDGDGDGDGDGNGDSEIARLIKRFETIERAYEEEKRKNAVADKKRSLKSLLKTKGAKDEALIDELLSEISLSEDTDIEAKADSLIKLYNKFGASEDNDYTPGSAGGGSEEHLFDNFLAAKQARDEWRNKQIV